MGSLKGIVAKALVQKSGERRSMNVYSAAKEAEIGGSINSGVICSLLHLQFENAMCFSAGSMSDRERVPHEDSASHLFILKT